ncbi:DDE-type integrase/transposase/recombinase [Kocuria sp. CPCC 205258]|uniref:DDE-type integrase/transposase/recombinase n=1 Tax=Kocuria sp. CPCC 205258 TaxID=3073552 RepID=UPI0034D5A9A3
MGGFLYVAVVIDAGSRRVVGWAMADHLRTELVLDAVAMAIFTRKPDPGLIHHNDRLNPGSTRRTSSAGHCAPRASWLQWVGWVRPLMMRWPRCSSPP